MEHILVTGGAGFIGSNLIRNLLPLYKVTAIDNFDDFYEKKIKESNIRPYLTHKHFHFIDCDIRNSVDLAQIDNISAIVHMAAKAGVRPSIKNPILYQDVNVNGTQTLLEFAKDRNIKQFIFASSSSVYGVNQNVPWHEEEKLLPISPYASTKLAGEMLGHVYSKLYGIRFLALRFFTVYGPGQRPDLAIHRFFKSILNNERIPVFGDGTSSRDYTFVEDIVKGVMAALQYDQTNFEIINLGNHKTVQLSKLIDSIENICGKKAKINRLPEQPGDVPRTFADISKAQRLLGYYPTIALLDGLGKFHEWYLENFVH